MKLKTRRNCHALYNLEYHLIIVTKYRKPCITPNVFNTIKKQTERIAEMNDVIVKETAYEPDHVHMLLSVPPQICLSGLINSIKTTSARRVKKEHPKHLSRYYWKPCFWSRSYMILSTGGAPVKIIQEYIRNQKSGN